jgi:CNT family concentrative nucleoside transporter
MGTSGAETLSCSADIFVGQTEAPLLIRPFLNDMTLSELLTVMVGGFATIAGGVLAGFIAMGISAGHLIAASVMSAPAALVVAKIIFPETQLSKTSGDVDLPKDLIESTNLLDVTVCCPYSTD